MRIGGSCSPTCVEQAKVYGEVCPSTKTKSPVPTSCTSFVTWAIERYTSLGYSFRIPDFLKRKNGIIFLSFTRYLANGRFRDRMGPAKGNSLLRSKEVFLANGRFRERMRPAKGILLAKFLRASRPVVTRVFGVSRQRNAEMRFSYSPCLYFSTAFLRRWERSGKDVGKMFLISALARCSML